jgi:nucleoside-diphosphate-sugar epimerase
MNRILITGATGAVGPRVVQVLHDAGYVIRTLSADPPDSNLFSDDIEVLIGDITDPSVVDQAVRDTDAVVHMASLLHITNPRPDLYEKYERVNVRGAVNVIKAAIRENVKKVIFFSTIAVYGNTTNQIITENTPLCPDTFYAQTKQAAEKFVLEAKDPNGHPFGTVLRFGAIYGARIKGNYRRLLISLKKGTFIPVGNGRNRRALIYDRDAAQAVLLSIQHPDAAGKVYNVTDGRLYTLRAIIAVMCSALGRPAPRISLPLTPVRWAISMLESAAYLFGLRLPIGRNAIDKYTEDTVVDSRLIQTELGFEAKYDLTTGMEEMIREMKKNGSL